MSLDWIGTCSYLTCPVDGCDWRLSMAEVELRTAPTSFTVDTRSLEIVARKQAETIEGIIRQHAESHDVLDYLRTVQRLKMDLAQEGSGIRPHVYENYRREASGDPHP